MDAEKGSRQHPHTKSINGKVPRVLAVVGEGNMAMPEKLADVTMLKMEMSSLELVL